MIGFAAERLMALEVGVATGVGYGEKSPLRQAQRNGYRERDWETRAGTVELLGARLTMLQTMDAEELRSYYRQRLREPAEEGSQGATIGLIEIARRASRPLIWDFHKIDPETVFFCLKVHV